MQELLPSYARVPPEDLLPVTTTNVRNVLEAIRNPDRDVGAERMAYRASGETRARQGITSDEMLNAWRIGLECVRESAHTVAADLRISTDVLLEFIEATLRWGGRLRPHRRGRRGSSAAEKRQRADEVERRAVRAHDRGGAGPEDGDAGPVRHGCRVDARPHGTTVPPRGRSGQAVPPQTVCGRP